MTIFVPIFLLVFLTAVTLLLRCAYLLARCRWVDARKTALVLAAGLLVYAATLIGVGLGSQSKALSIGSTKCFDDWCVRINNASRNGDEVLIQLDTINHGRRAQAPDSPRALVVADGLTIPVNVPNLADKIEGGSINPLDLRVTVPVNTRNVAFLVTEGGGPSELVIDDENSPFHAKSAWHLTTGLNRRRHP
jgi:hypothetical protein